MRKMQEMELKQERAGYTIIEVMLTLAITGAIFVAALLGVSSTISRQRYRDVVDNTYELIRSQYDLVNRVSIEQRDKNDVCNGITSIGISHTNQNKGRGRSACNVYGVAITFGLDDGKVVQTSSIIGWDLSAYKTYISEGKPVGFDPDTEISKYTDIQLLGLLGASNVYETASHSDCTVADLLTNERLHYDARIQTTEKGNKPFKATILIIRSPRDGAIHTYVYNYSGDSSKSATDYSSLAKTSCSSAVKAGSAAGTAGVYILDELKNTDHFKVEELKICLESQDMLATIGKRRMIRIAADGHNSSAVELIDMDTKKPDGTEMNECQ